MGDILDNLSISTGLAIILGANFLIIIILFLMNISNRIKLKKLRQKYNKFMNGLSDRNMEELLEHCIYSVNEVKEKNREIENQIVTLNRNMIQCMQKKGIVRYNAFENVGSDLSYSIALMDNNDDGFVISGIYSRDSSSSYSKPVIGGKSRYVLSAEEIQAIEIAKKSYKEVMYTEK
ncbi:MAG: DUF4446 family protein [Bacillota bacterium]|nr:DUF4446 family protein [Bacillota bacterium]